MRVALTGVPGTGKTTLADALARRGASIVHLNEFADAAGLLGEPDAERSGARVIDMDDLADRLDAHLAGDDAAGVVLIEGHFAHEMDVDLVILLRCDPLVLIERLRARGWSDAKVRENVEAEALDVLAQDVLETGVPAREVDVTHHGVEEGAAAVWDIVEDAPKGLKGDRVGTARWRLEALPWF